MHKTQQAKLLLQESSTNSHTFENIKKQSSDFIAIESRYRWLNTLSDTANGKIAAKEKSGSSRISIQT